MTLLEMYPGLENTDFNLVCSTDISVRAYNCLVHKYAVDGQEGYYPELSLNKILQVTRPELLKIRNFGPACLKEVLKICAVYEESELQR